MPSRKVSVRDMVVNDFIPRTTTLRGDEERATLRGDEERATLRSDEERATLRSDEESATLRGDICLTTCSPVKHSRNTAHLQVFQSGPAKA